jgi:hypothetical protein
MLTVFGAVVEVSPHRTAPHRTAPHRTALYRTAQANVEWDGCDKLDVVGDNPPPSCFDAFRLSCAWVHVTIPW